MPLGIFVAWASLVGACFGSFLSVCVWRIPREESVVRPRSHCPACGKLIPWYRNLPVFSWLALRGRCADCGARISPRYLLLEVLTAALFALVAAKFAFDLPLVLLGWVVVFGLELGAFIDLDWYILPDRVTVGGMALGVAASALMPRIHGAAEWYDGLLASVAGLALGFGLLWLVSAVGRAVYRREALGFGDVKLMGAVGALFGWRAVVAVLFLSSFAGSLAGIALMALGRRNMKGRIPYGPFIAVGALAWLLAGERMAEWYAGLLGG